MDPQPDAAIVTNERERLRQSVKFFGQSRV